MEKNVSVLIKNNLIAIVFHIFLCLVAYCLVSLGTLLKVNMLISLLAALVFGIIFLFLYFWVGKKFLNNTQNALADYLSVVGLFILLIASLFVVNGLANFPIQAVFWIVCEGFQMSYGEMASLLNNIILASMPSYMMWMGLLVKRKKAGLNENEFQKNENFND